jgi:ferric-dicitrate binding protein FerR (iron transport regulator)
VYNGEAASVVQYNTLTVPRGSKIVELTLTDGTKVVMNAASAITFPTVFAGNERKVAITGEAYFEVAHDKSKPFIVSKGDAQVEVLGTHFNVNAYDDEEAINVTLLEGSVRVTTLSKKQNVILKPGQMARITSKLELLPDVNINEVMAWKEGKFRFGEFASIETVMRQLSRWYDVEVQYKGKVSGHIGGTIERAANISQVLHILEMTGIVKFNIQGRKIIVMPR